tara:strand:+ start:427 stop:678 length:252 start_codon:yes stop_codon:yes gene_type:complete
MTRLVKVNTLAVAKRWKEKLISERSANMSGVNKRIAIFELPYQCSKSHGRYTYSDSTRYVVGNIQSIKSRISHLGERVDEEDL